MFLHRICTYLTHNCSIDYHSPNLEHGAIPARIFLTDRQLWQTKHGCFGPLRFYVDIPHRDDYTIILHLRDPRDVLVSMFYSYCYIHAGPVAPDSGYRKQVAAQGVDAFVLAKINEESTPVFAGDYGTGGHIQDLTGGLLQKYRDYLDNLLGRDHVIVLKYEEMVTDFPTWLQKFSAPFPLENREQAITHLVKQESQFFPQRSRDVMTHVRQIAPGDHRRKLKPQTIRELNRILGDILHRLEYA